MKPDKLLPRKSSLLLKPEHVLISKILEHCLGQIFSPLQFVSAAFDNVLLDEVPNELAVDSLLETPLVPVWVELGHHFTAVKELCVWL